MSIGRPTLLSTTLLALFCSACSTSGGSFDNAISTVPNTNNHSSSSNNQPAFVDAKAPESGDLTETGYVATVLCGQECFAKESADETDKVLSRVYDEQRTRIVTGGDYDTVEFLADFVNNKPVSSSESINVINGQATGGKWEGVYTDNGIDIAYYKDNSAPSYSSVSIKNFINTRVGIAYLYDKISDRMHWNIFYNGKNKTYDMPISGTATYTGNWAYATKNFKPEGSYEVNSGRQFDNYDLANNSVSLTADFANKTLTGDLKAEAGQMSGVGNLGKIHYQINANISQNGFNGTAKVGDENTLHNGLGNQTIKLGDATVSGSFYGSEAAELAGRINENSGQLVGVFAASRNNGGTGITTDGKLYQADYLALNGSASSHQITTQNQFADTNFSGNIKKLQIDGVVIDLDSDKICCDKYQAVSFGTYTKPTTGTNPEGGYFTQGFLTPLSEMPQTGTASYQGAWFYSGYGSMKGNNNQDVYALGAASKAAAEFTANFSNKTLVGKLHSPNGVIGSSTPVAEFTANINGNGFSGNTSTLSILTDYGDNTGNVPKITGSAKVEGHFYGEQANELAGKIWKDDKSFAGVFGGKKVQK